MSDGLTADDVREVMFDKPPWGKRGYDETSVDDFLSRVVERMEGRARLASDDVRNVRFPKPPIGKRGYSEDEVDALLDRIADAIDAMDGRA